MSASEMLVISRSISFAYFLFVYIFRSSIFRLRIAFETIWSQKRKCIARAISRLLYKLNFRVSTYLADDGSVMLADDEINNSRN
jgi:hypothetical protein